MARGCEVAVLSAGRFLENLDDASIPVKLDFSNAFKSLFAILPELASFWVFYYFEPSNLKYGVFSRGSYPSRETYWAPALLRAQVIADDVTVLETKCLDLVCNKIAQNAR